MILTAILLSMPLETRASEDEYLVGNWDRDRGDNLAVRRGHCVYMDTNFDGAHDIVQCYGNGTGLRR